MSNQTMWIDDVDQEMEEGLTAFLVRVNNGVQGWTRYEMRARPPHTNQSNEPRPFGWCGSWNDASTTGQGVWRVIRVAKSTGRVRIRQVTDRAELEAFLEECGYPDLIEDLVEGGST